MTVDPDLGESRIAKASITESEKILKRIGLKILCVLVEDSKLASKTLFRECGYINHDDISYSSKRDSNEV